MRKMRFAVTDITSTEAASVQIFSKRRPPLLQYADDGNLIDC